MRPIVSIQGVGKLYGLGERRPVFHGTLRDSLLARLRSPLGKGAAVNPAETFWALRDVSFDVVPGEIIGLIGRNGAGKSTLLKILSRITTPTEGRIELYGRVGSLLEVGTGFHPELTGRENIYLNGAILGMGRREIDRKFDAIVEFSELERFLDTPVKRYSSGMYMRLGFAVAAHLDPEIMVVDEVLAVGDAQFQKKCLGKIGEVARGGRTVFFVSHNMAAVETLCRKVVWLDHGAVLDIGSSSDIIDDYLKDWQKGASHEEWADVESAPGNDNVRLRRVAIIATDGSGDGAIMNTTPLRFEVDFWQLIDGARIDARIQLLNEQGVIVFTSAPIFETQWHGNPMPAGIFRSSCDFPPGLLNEGLHRIDLLFARNGRQEVHSFPEVVTFEVRHEVKENRTWFERWPGAISPPIDWTTTLIEEGISREGKG